MTLKQFTILAAVLIQSFVASAQSYNNIEFIENKGQWDTRVKYMGEVSAGAFFIRSGGFTVLQHNAQDLQGIYDMMHGHGPGKEKANTAARDKSKVLRSHAYSVDFVGASTDMQLVADKPTSGYNNYFIGGDRSKWAGECRIYQAVSLKNIYPNIDVRYYTDRGALKYDIIARPGADISKIALKYDGADKLQVKDKELVVNTSVGDLRESYPYTYQANGKEKKELSCKYIVKDNIVRFDIKGYDPTATLVIDPFIIFCSFTGSPANNWGFTATYGPDGSMYGGGIVLSAGFPVSLGAFQTTFGGGNGQGFGSFDIGIMKLLPNGSNRVYATYLGGSGNDFPQSMIVTPQGELVVAGRTDSPRMPTVGAFPVSNAANQKGSGGGFDITITKFTADGSNIVGSMTVGGAGDDGANITRYGGGASSLQRNYGDEARSEVNLDVGGNIYLASCTQSKADASGNGGFFIQGGVQATSGGGLNSQDGVVLKFTPDLSNVLFSTYLGGSGNDAAYVISLNPTNGDIYVAGGTESDNLPGPTAGTIGPSNNVNPSNEPTIDGFVTVLRNDGSAIIKTTYLGTPGMDQIYGIQFDNKGFPYVMGQTTGTWNHTNALYHDNNAKQFIAKLQPDLSAYVYSTVFGTSASFPNISPVAFLVDRCENVYVSGWGGLGNSDQQYPSAGTLGMPVTADAFQPTTDGSDFYFFVLKRDAVDKLYASFFGQVGGAYPDHVDGGTSRFDRNGVIYQGICANCGGGTTFPTTLGSYATQKPAGAFCNLAMVKIAFNLAGVGAAVSSAIGGVPRDTAGCLPLDVVFTDEIRNATQYIWNFGDGTGDFGPMDADTGYTRTHTFNSVGTFRVRLIAIDPASCNVRDTSYINIRVGDLKANLAVSFQKLAPCDAFNYQFNNLSTTDPSRPFTPTSFKWVFGDNTPPVIAGMNSVTHTFAGPGTYNGWLVLMDTAYCNYPDSIPVQVSVAANVKAGFSTDPFGCAPYTASFDNSTVGGQTYQWDFGDPASGVNNTSTAFEPTHVYAQPGTYTITMVATNPNTCNVSDTAPPVTIVVYPKPTSDFSFTPVTPAENTPNVFNNLASPDAVSFKWVFGDGDSLLTTSRAPVEHQYNATGTFNACLYAYNNVGCFDVRCRPVTTIVIPALDVPNAFTPNQPGVNSVVSVRGFGIAKMRFIIWNRWGQKVFETTNRSQGWNGRVKGVVQPMDVYAYTLDVEFFDGTKATKKGDITLIR